jgi:hypothetical protein
MDRRIVSSLLLFSIFAQPLLAAAAPARAGQEPARGQTVRGQSVAPAAAALDYDESHALIIGISHYANGWRNLPGVRRDVEDVRGALQKQGFRVTVKLDLNQADLDRALRDFVGAHGQNPRNRLVIYFAGHGHTLTTKDGRPLGYIVPADAPAPDEKNPGPFKSFAISMSDIEKFAREIESKHALFVFDSCFSGSLFRVRSNAVPDSISDLTDQQVRQFITAGTEKQTVPDESVFRGQFVKALAGEADRDRDGYITGTELGYFLRTTVTDYTRKMQTPEFGKIRDPDLDKGDIVFLAPGGPVARRPQPSPPPRREEVAPAAADHTAPSTPGDGGRWVVVADKRIEVAANEAMTDTGIQVRPGQYLALRASGSRINLGSYGYAGPGGVSRADARKPVSDCPTGALFARLGQEIICIESERSFTAKAAGKLQLGLNESNLSDNLGTLVVKVFVQEYRP